MAAGVAVGRGGRARAVVAGAVAASQLAVFLFVPTTADASAVWVPSVAEIVYR